MKTVGTIVFTPPNFPITCERNHVVTLTSHYIALGILTVRIFGFEIAATD